MRHNHWYPTEYEGWQQQGYGHHQNMQHWYRQINIIDAINIAVQRVPGEVVSAELETKGGRQVYEVEIVTEQGPKYEVNVDRSTGNIMNVELD